MRHAVTSRRPVRGSTTSMAWEEAIRHDEHALGGDPSRRWVAIWHSALWFAPKWRVDSGFRGGIGGVCDSSCQRAACCGTYGMTVDAFEPVLLDCCVSEMSLLCRCGVLACRSVACAHRRVGGARVLYCGLGPMRVARVSSCGRHSCGGPCVIVKRHVVRCVWTVCAVCVAACPIKICRALCV